jgi:ubiquinone/menaquinone biosynthesis C-methylase UbiE
MNTTPEKLAKILHAVREGYAQGGNAMAIARSLLGTEVNDPVATLLAYDLQTGNYNRSAMRNWSSRLQYCQQIVDVLRTVLPARGGRILEVGCGEATTLRGVLELLQRNDVEAFGFDISWSRLDEGRRFLEEAGHKANLFVADLFQIPLADNSMDVVYSSHSLEPNGGREEELLRECLRVARDNILAGTVLSDEILAFKRPGGGLKPYQKDLIVGKKLVRDIARNEKILVADVS